MTEPSPCAMETAKGFEDRPESRDGWTMRTEDFNWLCDAFDRAIASATEELRKERDEDKAAIKHLQTTGLDYARAASEGLARAEAAEQRAAALEAQVKTLRDALEWVDGALRVERENPHLQSAQLNKLYLFAEVRHALAASPLSDGPEEKDTTR